MEKETGLEKITGGLAPNALTTLIAASSGAYFAPLLPVLFSSLASERHKKRVENTIDELEKSLSELKTQIRDLSDAKYKLINDSLITVFNTVDEEKLQVIKSVIINTVSEVDLEAYEAEVIGRIIRDISIQEIKYLFENHHLDQIIIVNEEHKVEAKDNIKPVLHTSAEAQIVGGLAQIGLLASPTSGFGGTTNYKFSSICSKFIDLLNDYSG